MTEKSIKWGEENTRGSDGKTDWLGLEKTESERKAPSCWTPWWILHYLT